MLGLKRRPAGDLRLGGSSGKYVTRFALFYDARVVPRAYEKLPVEDAFLEKFVRLSDSSTRARERRRRDTRFEGAAGGFVCLRRAYVPPRSALAAQLV